MSRRSSTASSGRAAATAGPRVLHLDAFSGIAGNMLLGALLDLGASRRAVEAELDALGLGLRLRVRQVERGSLRARFVRFEAAGEPTRRGKSPRAKSRNGHGRPARELERILARSRLRRELRERALEVLAVLARAEGRVHGVAPERVHFHELGGLDTLGDIVGCLAAVEQLEVERVTCSPLPLGRGEVETAHGRIPLPSPATLELLRGAPVVDAGVGWETVTPTGAALVSVLVEEFVALPAMRIETVGHGAGNARSDGLPNVLRAVLGREEGMARDRVVCLETHIDDLVPEHFEYVMERLFEEGALDVALHHLQMKKNRPGFAIRVIARPSERLALARVLLSESTTLGVRSYECERLVLERVHRRIETPWGRMRVTLFRDGKGRAMAAAEYEDCKRAARRSGRPLHRIVHEVERLALPLAEKTLGRPSPRAR